MGQPEPRTRKSTQGAAIISPFALHRAKWPLWLRRTGALREASILHCIIL